MKNATSPKLPKKISVQVSDLKNPAWTEGMLGAPQLKPGRVKAVARNSMTKTKDPEIAEFEAALLRSVDQALRHEYAAVHKKR